MKFFRVFLFVSFLLLLACRERGKEVVIYTALDRRFSEPILLQFEQKSGIKVRVKYDTESTKTVGLTACLLEERKRPRCDVFWNNEILHTLRLKQAGVLAPYRSPVAEDIPIQFRDPDGYWTGFAARVRMLIVHRNRMAGHIYPKSIFDLANPVWKGKFGMAKPVAGTTATHVACLFAALGHKEAEELLMRWKENGVVILSGNKACAERTAAGELDMALTDSDDAIIESDQNQPVDMVYLDSELGKMGTLFIPNTVALIANCPHPEEGKKLIDFLLSPEVETMLALGPSAQIPLHSKTTVRSRLKIPQDIQPMKVDFEQAAREWDKVQKFILTRFLR